MRLGIILSSESKMKRNPNRDFEARKFRRVAIPSEDNSKTVIVIDGKLSLKSSI